VEDLQEFKGLTQSKLERSHAWVVALQNFQANVPSFERMVEVLLLSELP
jgi:hypothetical protein